MIITSDNGFALIGSIKDSTEVWHEILIKPNRYGDSMWMNHFYDTISSATDDNLGFRSIEATYDNGIIINGDILGSNQNDRDTFLLKTDSLCNTELYRTYDYTKTVDRFFR
jgi:hypothetical protein